jgi:hypothetical protein
VKLRHSVVSAILVFAPLPIFSQIAFQDDDPGARLCAGIFRGNVSDTNNVFSAEYHFNELQNTLKTARFKNYQEYSSKGASLGINIPVADGLIGFTGDYKDNEGTFQQEMMRFFSSSYQQEVHSSVFAQQESHINGMLLSVAQNCNHDYFESLKDRVKLWVEIAPSSYSQFTLTVKGYIPDGLATFTIMGVEPTPDVTCKSRGNAIRFPAPYPNSNTAYNCTKSASAQYNFTVVTNIGNSKPVLLPSAPLPTAIQPVTTSQSPTAPNVSLEIRTISISSQPTIYPATVASIPAEDLREGFVPLGGGCVVSYSGHGSTHAEVMVSSEPTDNGWKCAGADPAGISNLASATATLIYGRAVSNGSAFLQCTTKSLSSGVATGYPSVQVTMGDLAGQGYVLTSGGCSSTYAGHGSTHAEPVVISAPLGDQAGWSCQGADPAKVSNPASVTAHLVACRLERRKENSEGLPHLVSRDFTPSTPTGPASYPFSAAGVDRGFTLTGGGCELSYHDHGSEHAESMVENTVAGENNWKCQGADPPGYPNSATARAHAIGVAIR